MKRLLSVLTAFLLLISFFMPASSFAAVNAEVSMSAYSSPEALDNEGLVDVTVLITPTYGIATPESGLGISILSLSFEGREISDSSYAYIGSTKAMLLEDIYIDQSSLGKDLPITLTYIDLDRQIRSTKCDITIESTAPSASFSRSMSTNSGSPGDMIEIEYTVHNRSGVDFYDILVSDGFIGEIFTLDELASGKSHTEKISYELSRDVVSRPVLSYSYDGGDRQEKALDAKAIYVDGAALTLDLVSDTTTISQGGRVSLTLSVTNDTDDKLSDIKLYSADWLKFEPIEELQPGETRVFHQNARLYSDCDISIAAAVTDDDGKDHFCLCRTLSINVIDKNDSKSNDTSGLELTAAAMTEGTGTVLAIEIHNYVQSIKNGVISDNTLGIIEEIGDIPIGDSLFTLQKEFTEDTYLELTLSGQTDDGTPVSATAQKITINPDPIVIHDEDKNDENKKFNVEDYPLKPYKNANSWLFLLGGIVCVLVCVILLATLFIQIRILIRRHRRSKQKGK